MNSLSWMIYVADVIPNIGEAFSFLCFCVFVIYSTFTIIYVLEREKFHKVFWPIWVVVVLASIASVIPSQKTILMIAASESAERVMTTPQAQEVGVKLLAKLNALLDEKKN